MKNRFYISIVLSTFLLASCAQPEVITLPTVTVEPITERELVIAPSYDPGAFPSTEPSVTPENTTSPEPSTTADPNAEENTTQNSNSTNNGGTSAPNPTTPPAAPPAPPAPTTPPAKPVSELVKEYCATSPAAITTATNAKDYLTATNAERAKFGLTALIWSDSLATTAQWWSEQQVAADALTPDKYGDGMSHNPSPPGGENVAFAYSSLGLAQAKAAGIAHTGWMKSNGHCLNILNPDYRTMGAGMAQSADGTTWYSTVNFNMK